MGRQQAPDAAAAAPGHDPRAALLFTPPDPTRRVAHGEPIQLAGREWLAIHTPGHTLDHLCLYDPEHGILLSGDHVLPSITPHVSGVGNGADALAVLPRDARPRRRARTACSSGSPRTVIPFDDVPGRVEAIKEHHHERMEMLRERIARARARHRAAALARALPARGTGA